jgi:hypothetical protein
MFLSLYGYLYSFSTVPFACWLLLGSETLDGTWGQRVSGPTCRWVVGGKRGVDGAWRRLLASTTEGGTPGRWVGSEPGAPWTLWTGDCAGATCSGVSHGHGAWMLSALLWKLNYLSVLLVLLIET